MIETMTENMTETMAETVIEDKALLEDWVCRWGCSVSEIVLENKNFKTFRIPNVDGFIGYCIASGCAVVFGDPICAPEQVPLLAEAFKHFCQEKELHIVFIIASERFSKWAMEHNISKVLIEVGEELLFDPLIDPKVGPSGNRLRRKVNRAKHIGLTAAEYLGNDKALEETLLNVGNKWLEGRSGPQIYLGKLNFFENRNWKRWFYVKDKNGQVFATALLIRLEAYKGWLLKSLVRTPEAPTGTSELLMASMLDVLRNEKCPCVTYGIVPAERLGEMIGIGKISSWLIRRVYGFARWLFKFDKRKTYWEKFKPKSERCYILFSNPRIGVKDIMAIFKALQVDI